MKRYYKGYYGATASISEKRDGTVRLIIRDGYGRKYVDKVCKSVAGAKISLGKNGEGWLLTKQGSWTA